MEAKPFRPSLFLCKIHSKIFEASDSNNITVHRPRVFQFYDLEQLRDLLTYVHIIISIEGFSYT